MTLGFQSGWDWVIGIIPGGQGTAICVGALRKGLVPGNLIYRIRMRWEIRWTIPGPPGYTDVMVAHDSELNIRT